MQENNNYRKFKKGSLSSRANANQKLAINFDNERCSIDSDEFEIPAEMLVENSGINESNKYEGVF